MNIRNAEERDIPGVNNLLHQVLDIHADLRPDLFIKGTKKYTDEELKKIFSDQTTPVFVATDEENHILGYCFCKIQEYKNMNNTSDLTTLYIDDLCVDEQSRGLHIADALYNHTIVYAKRMNCHNITLNVWTGNNRARRFYEKMGLVEQKTTMEKILD